MCERVARCPGSPAHKTSCRMQGLHLHLHPHLHLHLEPLLDGVGGPRGPPLGRGGPHIIASLLFPISILLPITKPPRIV
ncbi:hypothetical protein EYF80_034695 [Liparis tanakae]|uniref:Uncharacterized protein n=1 Tax=Liparis tanakae TaxID=230148 RepID=A0A4Z2GPA5_9TELE|nr:hypothetical protein EYF80_034695 [Liparis tanakae]